MTKMTQKQIEELAAYADSHDFADEMDNGVWHDTVTAEPMVVRESAQWRRAPRNP